MDKINFCAHCNNENDNTIFKEIDGDVSDTHLIALTVLMCISTQRSLQRSRNQSNQSRATSIHPEMTKIESLL
jgi:hypothetical protein